MKRPIGKVPSPRKRPRPERDMDFTDMGKNPEGWRPPKAGSDNTRTRRPKLVPRELTEDDTELITEDFTRPRTITDRGEPPGPGPGQFADPGGDIDLNRDLDTATRNLESQDSDQVERARAEADFIAAGVSDLDDQVARRAKQVRKGRPRRRR